MRQAPAYRTPYCLYCYAALEPWGLRASQVCARCGRSTLHQDTRVYWTRERDMLQWEWAAKVLTFGIAIAVCAWLFSSKAGGGTAQGWAIGFPLAIVGLGTETAGKLTQFKPYFRADLAWIFLCLAPALIMLPFWALSGFGAESGLLLGFFLLLGTPCAVLVYFLSRRFLRFREREILRGQE